MTALLLAVASLLPAITTNKFMGCAQAYQLKSAGSSPGYNIVFVSAGFQTPDDLENYRCAVAGLVNGLSMHSPWKEHACELGFYRMDFVAEERGIGVDDACTDLPCDPQPLDGTPTAQGCPIVIDPPVNAHPIWPRFFVSTYNPSFDVRHCRQNLCRLVWPSPAGQDELLSVVDRCLPPVQAIVVVANSTTRGGGGDASPDGTAPGLAVVTVDEIWKPSAWRRLAHELGHAVGLLDEYDAGDITQGALGGYVCDRNVFKPPATGGTNSPCSDTAPWERFCSAHADPDCGPDPSAKCQTVVNPACDPCDVQGTPPIALHEGAFGQDCDYFRSEDTCLMRNYAQPACAVCKDILDGEVDQLGGRCFIRYHPMKLRVDNRRIDWDRCPTPPIPPIPWGDEAAPPGTAVAGPSVNLVCRQRDWSVRGVFARVVGPEGFRGEVAVRRAWIEANADSDSSHRASLELRRGRDGSSRRLVLSLGADAVSPSEWTAGIQRATRTEPPVVRVIDDVTGTAWTAEELTVEVEAPE